VTARASSKLRRSDVYPGAVVDGRNFNGSAGQRLRRRLDSVLVSRGERQEAELERLLGRPARVTRPNTVAVASPKGGVGKTTCAFVLGNLLAGHQRLRCVAVDANPDFGTLAALAPDAATSTRSLTDLLHEADRVKTATQLRAYVSALPTGLHLLGAPREPEAMAELGPERYGELHALLSIFYDVVILDLGTGLTSPLARFALERADQVVLVTTPDWITAGIVYSAVEHLPHERATLAVNMVDAAPHLRPRVVEDLFRERRVHRCVSIPYDDRLRGMLDAGCYSVGALDRGTRVALKRLGVAATEQLV
jgi:MinD-like ATPase involved in chromosome partitioning or flagellar assembly